MSQPITNNFAVEIRGTSNLILGSTFSALCSAISQWNREYITEDDEDKEAYLVAEAEDEEDDDSDADENEDEEEESDEEYTVEEPSDSTLNLRVTVSPEVLRDIRALQEIESDERLTLDIIYGTAPDTLTRRFIISPDVATALSSGIRDDSNLEIDVIADIYDAETLF